MMYSIKFLTPPTCRAARALLGWSQQDLAEHSGVGRVTIADYERGKTQLHRGSVSLIVTALDAHGVTLLTEGQGGVLLRQRRDGDGEGGVGGDGGAGGVGRDGTGEDGSAGGGDRS